MYSKRHQEIIKDSVGFHKLKNCKYRFKMHFIYKNIGVDVQLRCALPLVNKDAANLNNVGK